MASIYKRGKKGFFVAWFRDNNGRQICKTTKETDKKKAQKIAEAFEGAYTTTNVKEYIRETFNRLARELDPSASVPTVQEYFTQWMEAHSGELASTTIQNYKKRLEYFVEYIGAEKTMDSIRKSHALGFRSKMAKQSSNSNANNTMKIMSSVFGCAMSEGIITGNPFSKMKGLNSDSVAKKHFNLAQVKRLLSVADPEWRSMIIFGLYTAQRLGDLCTLTWGQIDFDRKEILFTTEKTDRNMAIPAHDALWAHILTLQRGLPSSPVHPRAFQMRNDIGIGVVSRGFRRVMVDAGLAKAYAKQRDRDPKEDTSKVVSELSFHSLRHATATWLREVNVSENIAMEIVGHDSKSVDRAYVGKTESERLRSEINKLPSIA
jgi:integrase